MEVTTHSLQPLSPCTKLALINIPNEILDRVCRLLPRRSLAMLVRSCRRLYEACAPALFTEVILGSPRHAQRFQTAILRQNFLADSTRTLDFVYAQDCVHCPDADAERLIPLLSKLQHVSLHGKRPWLQNKSGSWARGCNAGNGYGKECRGHGHIDSIMEDAINRDFSGIPLVTSWNISYGSFPYYALDDPHRAILDDIAVLLTLPWVKSLRVSCPETKPLEALKATEMLQDVTPFSTDLESLILRTAVGLDHLETILGLPRGLKNLQLLCLNEWLTGPKLLSFMRILYRQKATLESIRIEACVYRRSEALDLTALGSLRTFTCRQNVARHVPVFLPRSLVKLVILDLPSCFAMCGRNDLQYPRDETAIVRMISLNHLPNLRELSVEYCGYAKLFTKSVVVLDESLLHRPRSFVRLLEPSLSSRSYLKCVSHGEYCTAETYETRTSRWKVVEYQEYSISSNVRR